MTKRLKLIVQDDDMGHGTFVVKPALRGLIKAEAEDVLFCYESYTENKDVIKLLEKAKNQIASHKIPYMKCGKDRIDFAYDYIEQALALLHDESLLKVTL